MFGKVNRVIDCSCATQNPNKILKAIITNKAPFCDLKFSLFLVCKLIRSKTLQFQFTT